MTTEELYRIYLNHRHTGTLPDAPPLPLSSLSSMIYKGNLSYRDTLNLSGFALFWDTELNQLYFFTSNTGIGDRGWILIGGA